MHDIITILNLKTVDVQSFSCKVVGDSVSYYLTLKRKETICNTCSSILKIKDYQLRSIHHQVLILRNTKVVFRQRRYYCSVCHSTHLEHNPFSEPKSNLSHMTKINVMRYLKGQESTFSSTSRHFHLPVTTVVNIFDELGHMNRLPMPTILSIDEFYAIRKSKQKYACLLLDFSTGNVIDVLFGRSKKDWASYTQLIPKHELTNVKYICIDMFETYRSIKKLYFPNAILCCDSFHVVSHVNKQLRQVRLQVMHRYIDTSIEYYLLKNFNWLLMMDSIKIYDNKAKYNHRLKQYINYPALLEMLIRIDSTLKEAYELKEAYLLFNQISTIDNAAEELAHIIELYQTSSIASFRETASTLINWFEEIVNSFTIIDGKRVSNGKIESTNSRIKTILKVANGYQNFSRLRNKIMYVINKEATITIHKEKINIKRPGKKRGSYKKN